MGLQILRCDRALLSVTFCDGQQVGEANTLVSVSTIVASTVQKDSELDSYWELWVI